MQGMLSRCRCREVCAVAVKLVTEVGSDTRRSTGRGDAGRAMAAGNAFGFETPVVALHVVKIKQASHLNKDRATFGSLERDIVDFDDV